MRCLLPLLCLTFLAAEDTAVDLAGEIIRIRAGELRAGGRGVLAGQLEELAAAVRAGRVSLVEAQQVLAIAQALPEAPATEVPGEPGAVESQPAPIAGPAAVISTLDGASPAPAVAPPAVASGSRRLPILAVQPGPDGRPSLIALGGDQALAEGQDLMLLRGGKPMAKARVSRVKPGLTIALVVPGTWTSEEASVGVDDEASVE